MAHQRDAVHSGFWPLYRFHPGEAEDAHPFRLDSHEPKIPYSDFARQEARFAMLARTDPDRFAELSELAQADIDERWRFYEQLAGLERTVPHTDEEAGEEREEGEGEEGKGRREGKKEGGEGRNAEIVGKTDEKTERVAEKTGGIAVRTV